MILRTIIKALKPFRLISLVLMYILGGGLVQYVQDMQSWSVFFLGGFFLIIITLSLELLILLQSLIEPEHWPDGMGLTEVKAVRMIIAAITATLLTASTTIIIGWVQMGILWQGLLLLLLAFFVIGGFYFVSQFDARFRSLALLIEVLLYVIIPPAVAYFLQSDEPHLYLTLVVISLVPAYLANRILSLLLSFGRDQKYEVETLVTKLGWKQAMFYHNAMILFSYFLFALIGVLGVHWFIIWPIFLTLPIGVLEIWLMERVRRGMKPLWGVMRFATGCVFFIPLYLVGFAFWIR